jgi:hypothetical protein
MTPFEFVDGENPDSLGRKGVTHRGAHYSATDDDCVEVPYERAVVRAI